MKPADNREEVLFREARQRPAGPEREAYLDQACAGNQALRARLAALLKAHESPDPFLEPPAAPPGATSALSTPLTEKPGDRIGHYKLLQQIGEGGCGVVYMAEQEQPIRRRVALKVIKLGMDTKHVIARFEAERQALALMDHPNIAKVLDAGATDTGRPYFVMELVRGTRITDYCDQNNLSTEQRLDLFVQICHAIQHAHQKGIIHRDIKPSNILVTLHDGKPLPKIIDFGIAKATSGQLLTDKTLFTAFEQFIGTPAYMSPEQAEMSTLDIDTRSDVYALGVLLYELLTGQTPFDAQELVAAGLNEMRRIIREQEPLRPSTRISTLQAADQTTVARRRHSEPPQLIHLLRGDLDWIVMKCLEKDRTRRYETVNGLADDVLRHLNDEPVMARPPGRVYRLQKLVRRNKLVFAAASAVAAALLIGLGLSTWLFFREQLAHGRAVAAEKMQSQLRQQAQAEAEKSGQIARLLKEMLQGVGPSVARGRDATLLKEILDKTAERVGKELKGQPEVEAELRSTIGGVYDALGQFQKAEAMHRSAVILRRALWGNMNTNVADSLDSLGWALLMQDKVDAAEPCFQEALAIRTNLLGSENVKVAASLYHLGCVGLFQAGSEAERFFRESLAMRRKFLGNENADVAEALSGLSTALGEAGKPDQAEAAVREALAIQARLAPGEPPSVDAAIAQGRLAGALLEQKRFAEAELLVRQALTLVRNLLGTENYYFAAGLDLLAQVLVGEEKLAEAETVTREALATSRRALGEQSFTTAYCLSHLGMILHKTGRLAEAETAFREALEVGHQLGNLRGGSATINAAWTCGLLAKVLQEQGRAPEAEALYRAEADTVRKSPVPGSRASALTTLGDWLRDQGKPSEAEPLYREALEIRRSVSPGNLGFRQWPARGLASTLRSQGKLDEVEALYRAEVEAGRKFPASDGLANALGSIGDILRDQGKPAEAEPLYREGLDICRKVSPDKFEVRQWLASGLALTLQKQGKLAEAELLYREALTNAVKVWPDTPAKWKWLVNEWADVLESQGRAAEVEPLLAELLKPAAQAQVTGICLLRVQARVAGRRGQWKDTASALSKVVALDPSDAYEHLQLAAVLAETGDFERYRTHCGEILKRFAEAEDLDTMAMAAKACLLVPGACPDLETASKTTRRVLAMDTGSSYRSFRPLENGLAEYRHGDYDRAIASMRRVLGQPMAGASPLTPAERDVAAGAVLAMAHYQLGQGEQARHALAAATNLSQTKLPQLGRGPLDYTWVDWLIAEILLREAKTLINNEPQTGAPDATTTEPRAR